MILDLSWFVVGYDFIQQVGHERERERERERESEKEKDIENERKRNKDRGKERVSMFHALIKGSKPSHEV